MLRSFDKIRNLLLALAMTVLMTVSLRAHAWECFDMGLWGMSEYCETDEITVCVQDPNPGGVFCDDDFEDTCNAFCGYNNWIGDDCYWGDVRATGGGWHCADDWFIRCICTSVGR